MDNKSPIVIENEQVFGFDIDLTMISKRRKLPEHGDIYVENPYTKETVYFKPHYAHMDLLKEMHGRGRYIIIWTASGTQWAKAIVEALELTQFVHIIMTKPIGYIDDLPVEQWLNNRIYLHEGERG